MLLFEFYLAPHLLISVYLRFPQFLIISNDIIELGCPPHTFRIVFMIFMKLWILFLKSLTFRSDHEYYRAACIKIGLPGII